MKDIVKWICKNLLFDTFELVFWLNIVDKDCFDILNVRQYTNLHSRLKYEYLLLYIGLHLKVHLNYQNTQQMPSFVTYKPTSQYLNVMT